MKDELYFTSTKLKCRDFLYFIAFLLFFSPVYSQISQTDRYEINLNQDNRYIELIPNGERGLFLFQELADRNSEGNFWKMTKLDTALKEEWHHLLIIDRNYSVSQIDTLDGTAYVLLTDFRDPRNSQIIKINSDGELVSTPFRNLVPLTVTEFQVIDKGRKLLMGGYFNYRPIVLVYDFSNNRPRILPGLINEVGNLLQLSRNEELRTIDVLLKINDKFIGGIWYKSYNYEGELLSNLQFDFPKRKSLVNGRTVEVDANTRMLVGPYGTKYSQYSSGLFIGLFDREGLFRSRFINYADLPNFFDYASDRRQKRVKRRLANRREREKEPRFNFRIMIQDLKKNGDDFVLMGESHYVKYNQNYYQNFSYTPPQIRRMIFDGYVYTHAFLVGLNLDGQVNWDQSIRTRNIKKYDLDRLVHFSLTEKRGVLMYPSREKIQFNSFEIDGDGNYTEGEIDIRLMYPDDKIRANDSYSSNIQFWYRNNYYVHGTHVIKNLEDNTVPLNRKVFYINKIQYLGADSAN